MHITPEFVAAVIFGVIMIVIGLCGIWIVHWQTHVLLRQQRESTLSIPDSWACFANLSADVEQDIERAQNSVLPARSDTELSNLSTASTLKEEPDPKDTALFTSKNLDMTDVDEV